MLIIGTKLFVWGSTLAAQATHCGQCGAIEPFIQKTGMKFITLFFFIPVIPISGKMKIIECPRCKTRYQPNA
jgi:hypothetical protein